MNIVSISKENIDKEHICCALDSKSSTTGIKAKKDWLKCRIEEGLRFKKLDARGKVFIEYLPLENAWIPVEGKNYMFINCHWVSGSFKDHGYGKALLEECENDAISEGMDGVVVIAGNKKKPYLSDKSFYIKHGYDVCDSAAPFFELVVKRFNKNVELPRFADMAKTGIPADIKGIDIFYTPQCPFTTTYIELLKPVIMASEANVRTHLITSKEEAKSHFCPVTTYSVFINGKFHSNEILTPAKLEKLIDKM